MCRSLFLLLLAVSHVVAADLLPADRSIPQAIDHYIQLQWKELDVKPARPADEVTILRRLTLDLNGRIPTASEVEAYLADKSPDKKVKLVERLMASPAFQRHLVTELDTLFAPPSSRRSQGNLREYLTAAIKENRSWDKVFRDLILADEKEPIQKGASQFIKSRVRDLDRLTNDVSVLFFGVNISCAQCHDHPLVADWKQDHYYGLKSFLARSFEAGKFLGERDEGVVTFKTPANVQKTAKMMFLTGKVIDAPGSAEKPMPKGKRPAQAKGDVQPPAPKWSARAALVDSALSQDGSKFLARAMVNRMWAQFYGQGLVTPLDQMHSENPPSHPELLDWLARDTANHGYDLRRLIKGLVLSDTYALSSRYDGDKWPLFRSFAVAAPRPLTPAQMATSLKVATTAPTEFAKPAELENKITGLESSARGFASLLEQPPVGEEFQIGVSEALLFSNSDRIQRDFLTDSGSTLVGTLKNTKDLEKAAELAVLNVLSRPATAEEKQAIVAYVSARKDKLVDAYRQALWALIASAEFRFNH